MPPACYVSGPHGKLFQINSPVLYGVALPEISPVSMIKGNIYEENVYMYI